MILPHPRPTHKPCSGSSPGTRHHGNQQPPEAALGQGSSHPTQVSVYFKGCPVSASLGDGSSG